MRVLKVEGLSLVWVEEAESEEEEQEEGSGYWDEYWAANKPTTRYYYEGQMGIEEDFTRKVSGQDQTDVIRHGLGARGIDFIETDAYNASPSGAYPLYDGHGNMIATLTKQPTNSFSLSARRYTDPWGVTRVGASTGKPDQRYCANLGHRQDDESGLTYMRARYYEPTTGRFVSEDQQMDGVNWFVYARNSPVLNVDAQGTTASAWGWAIAAFLTFLVAHAASEPNASFFRNGLKFLEAVVLGLATGYLNSKPLSDWTSAAADKVVRNLWGASNRDVRSLGKTTRWVLGQQVIAGFYAGYGMFLFFLMASLDAWVDSTTGNSSQ